MAKKLYEGSKADTDKDKKQAKSSGKPFADWEKSPADAKMDAKKMASGGTVRGAGAATRGTKYSKA